MQSDLIGSSLQSNGQAKHAEGVAPTPCKRPTLNVLISVYSSFFTNLCLEKTFKGSLTHEMAALATPQPSLLD